MRRDLISFDDFINESFWKANPGRWWYVYGDIYNKIARAVPHQGYEDLQHIINEAGKRDKHWIYHDGVDNLYQKANYPPETLLQAKGSLFDWQCK